MVVRGRVNIHRQQEKNFFHQTPEPQRARSYFFIQHHQSVFASVMK
jgi:hypothetical protein